jgi:hypothetical protein
MPVHLRADSTMMRAHEDDGRNKWGTCRSRILQITRLSASSSDGPSSVVVSSAEVSVTSSFAIAVTLIEFVRGIARSVNVTTIPRMRSCRQAPFALESEIGNAGPLQTLAPEYHEKGMKQPAERDFGDIFRQ